MTARLARPSRSPREPAGARPGGFALVAVLLVLLGLSAVAAGGLFLAGTEASASRSHAGSVRALLAAEARMATFLDRQRGLPPSAEIVREETPRPRISTRLEAHRLLVLGPDRELWTVSVRGEHRSGHEVARRTVTRLVRFQPVPARPVAAAAAAGGLEIAGGDASLDGRDPGSSDPACAGSGPQDVAGAATPPGGYRQAVAGPLLAAGRPDTLGIEPAALLAAAGLDWPDLLAHPEAFDVRLPGGMWPADDGGWRAILADVEALALDGARSGRGLVVVRGDLALRDGFHWDGTLLVGGRLVTDGAVSVSGTVMAGLADGGSAGPSRIGEGPAVFRYDACAAARAGRALAVPVAVPGTWTEAFTRPAP